MDNIMEEGMKKKRILISKVGLDGHDLGAKVVAKALRDAGVEVIYTGWRQTPEKIVNSALQEDVDGIGISILSGAHMLAFSKILRLCEEKGIKDTPVFGGGIIPEDDILELKKMGVREIFPAETDLAEIIEFVKKL
jgi:methylmalonyl-CoA mutase C-terminal domain/subunit